MSLGCRPFLFPFESAGTCTFEWRDGAPLAVDFALYSILLVGATILMLRGTFSGAHQWFHGSILLVTLDRVPAFALETYSRFSSIDATRSWLNVVHVMPWIFLLIGVINFCRLIVDPSGRTWHNSRQLRIVMGLMVLILSFFVVFFAATSQFLQLSCALASIDIFCSLIISSSSRRVHLLFSQNGQARKLGMILAVLFLARALYLVAASLFQWSLLYVFQQLFLLCCVYAPEIVIVCLLLGACGSWCASLSQERLTSVDDMFHRLATIQFGASASSTETAVAPEVPETMQPLPVTILLAGERMCLGLQKIVPQPSVRIEAESDASRDIITANAADADECSADADECSSAVVANAALPANLFDEHAHNADDPYNDRIALLRS